MHFQFHVRFCSFSSLSSERHINMCSESRVRQTCSRLSENLNVLRVFQYMLAACLHFWFYTSSSAASCDTCHALVLSVSAFCKSFSAGAKRSSRDGRPALEADDPSIGGAPPQLARLAQDFASALSTTPLNFISFDLNFLKNI